MHIVFTRGVAGFSTATIHRNDGVVVELPSYSRTHRVPHDLAHAVAEREFGLADGVFGSIAAGAMFDNMRVVAGRPRHDAAARNRRVLAAHQRALTVAELLAGVLHDAVEHGRIRSAPAKARHDWGIVNETPLSYTDRQVLAAVEALAELAARWDGLPVGGTLEFRWPDELIHPVPPVTRRSRR